MLSDLKTKIEELKQHREDLKAKLTILRDELPRYEEDVAMLSEEVANKKREKVSRNKLSKLLTDLQAASELLEQHHSDIATTESELKNDEALLGFLETLLAACESSERAEGGRTQMQEAINTIVSKLSEFIPEAAKFGEGFKTVLQERGEFQRVRSGVSYNTLNLFDEEVKKHVNLKGIYAELPEPLMPIRSDKKLVNAPQPFSLVIWQILGILCSQLALPHIEFRLTLEKPGVGTSRQVEKTTKTLGGGEVWPLAKVGNSGEEEIDITDGETNGEDEGVKDVAEGLYGNIQQEPRVENESVEATLFGGKPEEVDSVEEETTNDPDTVWREVYRNLPDPKATLEALARLGAHQVNREV
jgi:hypothetical protein